MKTLPLLLLSCTLMAQENADSVKAQKTQPDAPSATPTALENELRAASAAYHPTPPEDLYYNQQTQQWERKPGSEYPSYHVFDKSFIIAHSAFLGSIVYDVELTHQGLAHHKCVEGNDEAHPSRGGLYANDLAVFGAITGLDAFIKYGTKGWFGKAYSIAAPIPGTILHFKGGTKWLTDCW